jgi:hypothetical protein
MRNVFEKRCRENQNTHFVFNNFLLGNSALYGKMWKSIVEPGRLQMTILPKRFACWVSKVTNKVKNVKFTLEQDTMTQTGEVIV